VDVFSRGIGANPVSEIRDGTAYREIIKTKMYPVYTGISEIFVMVMTYVIIYYSCMLNNNDFFDFIIKRFCLLITYNQPTILYSNHLVISSAAFMFQRFMMCQAFQNHDRFIVCATCIFLAGKVEEQPKRLKDVVDVFLLIRSKVQSKSVESVSIVYYSSRWSSVCLMSSVGYSIYHCVMYSMDKLFLKIV
jgi:hypothetical protein